MVQHFEDFFRAIAVALGMAVDKDGVRAHFIGGAQRHGRMHAEFARFV
jgi:hypothetical protein